MKKQPVRTCIACRESNDKRQLVRITRSPQGEVSVDPTGKKPGRGAYVCKSPECFQKALSGSLEKALKVKLDTASKERLAEEFASL